MPSSFVSKMRTRKTPLVGRESSRHAPRAVAEANGTRSVPATFAANRSLPAQFLSPQNVMIVLGEAVGLVADVLQQPQRRRIPAQAQRLRLTRTVDLFFFLGQRQETRCLGAQHLQRFQGGVQLALAA